MRAAQPDHDHYDPLGAVSLHKLIQRQIRRYIKGSLPTMEEWSLFLAAVNEAYEQSDADRVLLERALEISSQEQIQTNEHLRLDVAKRKATEMELESSLSVLRATQDGILAVDHEGNILSWYQSFAEMWGIPELLLAAHQHDSGLQLIAAN